MIADLKPYAEYKESGLPWIGQVPGHWDVRRMKSSVMNVIEQTLEMSSDEVYIALEHVESWTGKARPQLGSNLFTGQVKRFRQGDVLFGKLRPYLAKVTRISNDGVCAGEFFVLRPADKAVSSAYLEYQLRAKHTIDVINGSTFGAKMPRADWQFCGNLPIPLPPPTEQAAIVRFLDWANGRLEQAIRAKRKVIALLNEQKQAIIHRAVTCGLEPSVPLKPSGIPWLGDIPQHWEVMPLKGVCAIQSGITLGKDYTGQALREYPYLRVANVQAGHVNLSVVKTIRVTKAEADRCTL
ncbi:MAG: restriction endonuclease subunit S, partial [Chromatiaceae bacterium]